MKTLLSETPGGPATLVLREVPEPTPGPGQLRIAVRACGINYPDVLLIEDKYQVRPPRPFAPGLEVSGVVDALGDGVAGFTVGERVIAHLASGGPGCSAAAAKVMPAPRPRNSAVLGAGWRSRGMWASRRSEYVVDVPPI